MEKQSSNHLDTIIYRHNPSEFKTKQIYPSVYCYLICYLILLHAIFICFMLQHAFI